MRLQNPFSALNPTGIDSQVLTVLARSNQYMTVHEIYRLLPEEGSEPGIRKALYRLVEQGVVHERVTGRSYAYSLNSEHLMADVIRKIANTKNELILRIKNEISTWPVQPVTVKMFGSAARNEMRADSDIDLLVVMPDDTPDGLEDDLAGVLAKRAYRWTGNDVRPLIYRSSEVRPSAIFDSILKDGVDIAGDPKWLRKKISKKRSI